MKIFNTLIISIASILIVAICSKTVLLLQEKTSENLSRIDTVELTDKDKIEILVTLNAHRLELVKTIMHGDTILSDEEIKFFDKIVEDGDSECITMDVKDLILRSKKARLIIKDAIFLERAISNIVMNDSLLKNKRLIEAGF